MQPVCSVRTIQPSAPCNRAARPAKQPAARLWQMKSESIEQGGRDGGVRERKEWGGVGG